MTLNDKKELLISLTRELEPDQVLSTLDIDIYTIAESDILNDAYNETTIDSLIGQIRYDLGQSTNPDDCNHCGKQSCPDCKIE